MGGRADPRPDRRPWRPGAQAPATLVRARTALQCSPRCQEHTMIEVAFIGLGAMGSHMAMNLHKAGFALRVWNRDRAKARALVDAGARLAAGPSVAAQGGAVAGATVG